MAVTFGAITFIRIARIWETGVEIPVYYTRLVPSEVRVTCDNRRVACVRQKRISRWFASTRVA